jgi:hypothetical protein
MGAWTITLGLSALVAGAASVSRRELRLRDCVPPLVAVATGLVLVAVARGASASIAAFGVGVACASLARALRRMEPPRPGSPSPTGDADRIVRTTASTLAALSTMVFAGACVTSLVAHAGQPIARPVSAWALGAFVVSITLGAVGPAATLAVAIFAGATLVAPGASPGLALPAVILTFASIAGAVGVAAVRVDPGEPPDAARLRGFATAGILSALGGAAAVAWWARPGLALAVPAGLVAALLALVVGRHHDDPRARPRRTIDGVRSTKARTIAAFRIGIEGGAILVAVGVATIFVADRAAVHASAVGTFGVAVAGAVLVGISLFLETLARIDGSGIDHGGEHEVPSTIAQDVVTTTFAVWLLAGPTVVSPSAGAIASGPDAVLALVAATATLAAFVVLRLRVPRAAVAALAIPIAIGWLLQVAGRSAAPVVGAAGLVAGACALLLSTATERATSVLAADPATMRIRACAASLPAFAASFAILAAFVRQ